MSLSLDQLFLSPSEEKRVQLQNRPYIGEEQSSSSDEYGEETNKVKLKNKKYNKNEHLKNETKLDHKTSIDYSQNCTQFINQFKDQPNQTSYAAFSSNQMSTKEMSNNLNYSNSKNYKTSTNKQNDRIKCRKTYYNEHDDYETVQQSDQIDDLLAMNEYSNKNEFKNELNESKSECKTDFKNEFKSEIKNSENDLINHKSASALIKKGNLFKNIDYFNKQTLPDELYGNRKIERRKARKTTNFPDLLQPDIKISKEYAKNKELARNDFYFEKNHIYRNSKDLRLIDKNDKQSNDSFRNRTQFFDMKRNYSHYVHKDLNSKRASISSAEISKYDTLSSSSSASPIQDRKTDLNDMICIKNNYVGFNIDDVINIDKMNRRKNLKEQQQNYSSTNSSILDEDTILDNSLITGKLSKTQCSNQKVNILNDLLTIENDDLNKMTNNDNHDVFMNSNDFSSSFMHKSTIKLMKPTNERKSSIEQNFNLVDFIKDNDKMRRSPELLKFNDDDDDDQVDYNQQMFSNKNKSDLLTADDCSSLKESNESITLISNTQSVLQPKILNVESGSLMNEQSNESKDNEELNGQSKHNQINNQTNNFIDEIELDEDKNYDIESEQDDVKIDQQTPFKIQSEQQQRKSSGESVNEFKIQNDDSKETTFIYSRDLKNALVNSQLNSSTSSESTFNSTVITNKAIEQTNKQSSGVNLSTESASSMNSSFEGSLSRDGPKTPGYTQRILNNSEQVKYGLFQLGTSNTSNSLVNVSSEPNEEELKDEETKKFNDDYLQSIKQDNKQSIPRDISRDELVKSILNIPFPKYDDFSNQDDNDESSQNSSLNQNTNHSKLGNYRNLEPISTTELENLNLDDNKSIVVTNRNASLGDLKLNNSSTCKQLKEHKEYSTSSNVNSSKTDLKISRQNSNTSLEQDCNLKSKISASNSSNNLVEQQSDLTLDLVLDKSLSSNLSFVSNSMSNMSNSNLLNKSTKLSNGRLSDYMMDDCKPDMQKNNQTNLIDSEFINKSERNEDHEKSSDKSLDKNSDKNLDKFDKMDKEKLLIDTSDLNTPISSISNQFIHLNNQNKLNPHLRKDVFGQVQSKILQETVNNHLLSDSFIDLTEDSFNSNQFEQQPINKKSPKKHRNYNNDLCYPENTHNHRDKNYSSSRHILNSKFNTQHNKTSEDSVRNFSLSPETTDCDSVEVESEFSMSSFVSIPGLNQMPILEDGLSSGSEASDTETSQQTKLETDRLKKQLHQNKIANNDSPELELFAKCRPRIKKNQHMSDYELHSENYNRESSNQLNEGRQHPKKSKSLNNNNMHLNNGLDSETEHTNENSEHLWNDKQPQQIHQSQQSRGHLDYNQTGCEKQSDNNEAVSNSLIKLNDEKPKLIEKTFHEDDCDTDTETDRLLGAQRSEDRTFYEDNNQPKKKSNSKEGTKPKRPSLSRSVLIEGVLFRARYLGSTQLLICDGTPTKAMRMMQAEEAVSRIKSLAPEGETQPSTEVDLFISTEKIMVLNTDLKTIMMDHGLRSISYIADIGDLLVLMARRRQPLAPTSNDMQNVNTIDKIKRATPKMICHVFESDEAQFIAQSIGQAFQVAYMEFLKKNGIEDPSFAKEMDYQEVLNSQEISGNELEMFSSREKQKEVIVPKKKGEILGIVIVESGWGSMLPTVVVANMAQQLPAARCGGLNIGDQIIAINGISLVGLPLTTCQNYIKNAKNQTVVKFTVVPCHPTVEVKIRRPETKYQLGFSVQNGVICSLLRGGIAERGGVRVGHRIIDINGQSVVAIPHEKIVNLLATSVGEIHMKTMPTSIFRLLTGQELPVFM